MVVPKDSSISSSNEKTNVSVCNTIAGVLGNALEWYDFALFGFFSDIIADVFFPPNMLGDSAGAHGNLIVTFLIFGSAFVMRPVGGVIIGYFGDKYGRGEALANSLFLMALPTFALGFLPTYDQIGYWAPFLLTLCRLAQGISVGGQLPTSIIYTMESHPKEQWGYYASLPLVAACSGALLGNLAGATIREVLTEDQLYSFGWRLPFYSGILIAFVAFYLKLYGAKVHTNAGVFDGEHSEHTNPIALSCLPKNRSAILSAALICSLQAGGFYMIFLWLAIYMETLREPEPIAYAFWINALANFIYICALPVTGIFSDAFGRAHTMTIAAICFAIWGPITMTVMVVSSNPFLALAAQSILGLIFPFYVVPMWAWLVETFDPEVRLTSMAIGYDIAHVLGGFAPAIATTLVSLSNQFAPAIMFPIMSAMGLTGIYFLTLYRKEHGIDDRDNIIEIKNANDIDTSTRNITNSEQEESDI